MDSGLDYYTILNDKLNIVLSPFREILNDSLGVPKLPRNLDLFYAKATLNKSTHIPDNLHDKINYYNTLALDYLDYHPAFHVNLGHINPSPLLFNGEVEHPTTLQKLLELSSMLKDNYFDGVDDSLVVDAFKLLYQLGYRNNEMFSSMYTFGMHLNEGDLIALCGIMAQEGNVKKEIRNQISSTQTNIEFAEELYEIAIEFESDLGSLMFHIMEVEQGYTKALQDIKKFKNHYQYKYLAQYYIFTLDESLSFKDAVNGLQSLLEHDWIEALPLFVELTKNKEIPSIRFKSELIQNSMKTGFLPFLLIGDLAESMYSKQNYDSAVVLWSYLSEIGYIQATMSVAAMLESGYVTHYSSNETDTMYELLNTIKSSTDSWIVKKKLQGWVYRALGDFQMRMNESKETVLEQYEIAAKLHDMNALVNLAIMYQYGMKVNKNLTKTMEYIDTLKDVKRNGLSVVLLTTNYCLDVITYSFLNHWLSVLSVFLLIVASKFYVRLFVFH
ncbi:Uncharacterized protein QTN25_002143 [Entamoeba marina]